MDQHQDQDSSSMMPPPAAEGAIADEGAGSSGIGAGLPSKEERVAVEKQQEKILKAKYPMNRAMAPNAGGHSAFLQKRLAKGQKYFDSGDYQMAKQQKGRPGAPRVGLAMPVLAQPPTGETIPTPDLVPARKTSIIQPLHDHSQALHLPSDPAHATPEPGRPMPNPAVTKLAS